PELTLPECSNCEFELNRYMQWRRYYFGAAEEVEEIGEKAGKKAQEFSAEATRLINELNGPIARLIKAVQPLYYMVGSDLSSYLRSRIDTIVFNVNRLTE